MLNNRFARAAVWTLIEDQWDALLAQYPPAVMQYFAAPVPSIVEPNLADRVAAWLKGHPVPAAAPQIAQALELQAVNRAMAERIRDEVAWTLAPV